MAVKEVRPSGAYVVHGVHIDVSVEDPRLVPVAVGLFGQFPSSGGDAFPRDRLICTIETAGTLPAVVPVDAAVVHESAGLRVSSQGSRLFVEVEGLSVSVADLEDRRLAVHVAREQVDSTWSIQHFSVLPLAMELLRLRGLHPVHAAALELDGKAVLLPAQPGSGKSTLSIALVRHGLRLLSDDMPFVSRTFGPEVLAFPEDVNVCADGVGFFDELSFLAERTPNERGKHAVALRDLFPDREAERAVPRLLVFPRLARSARSRLRAIEKREALVALLEHSLPPLNRVLAASHFETMMDVVASCDCYRLDTGLDPDEAAELLASLLARSSASIPEHVSRRADRCRSQSRPRPESQTASDDIGLGCRADPTSRDPG